MIALSSECAGDILHSGRVLIYNSVLYETSFALVILGHVLCLMYIYYTRSRLCKFYVIMFI
jgi:hypothetical protein